MNSSAAGFSGWLPLLEARPNASVLLFAFPYAGGGTPVFRPWLGLLPSSIELRVVQLPGRGPRFRETHLLRAAAVLDALEENLLPLLNRPFAFFGHSLGALLAFEMTRRLRARGLAPVELFVSGHLAPQLPDPFPPIHQLPEPLFLKELVALNGMHPGVLASPDLLELVLPIVRSDFTILETYEYDGSAPAMSCPLTVFGGDRDPRTNRPGLEAWRAQTSGHFELQLLPGDHFFIDANRPAVVATLLARLASATGENVRQSNPP